MEVLAPAGNMDALKAAVACGADAVYLGTKDFNARSKAENFSDEELRLAVSYCHERGVRVYVTFNTIVKDREIAAAVQSVGKAIEAGADAFLIQDLGLYKALNGKYPNAVFHASTQMGVHNAYGAKFAEKMGFDRVVMSREVLSEDLKQIKQKTNVEVELFVHGAHCVSFSGNCYFSSMVSGYSGNRGKCLQLCRKKYTLTDGKRTAKGYELSAKDICMLGDTDKLKELGVDSLKIEGRLRSTEYAGTVSEVYKRAICGKTKEGDLARLKTVFNRGDFSEAYIDNDRPNIIFDKQQNNIGINISSVSAIKGNSIIWSGNAKFKVGDGYKILRGGREVGSARYSGGKLIYSGRPMKGDEIRLTKSAEIAEHIKSAAKADKRDETRIFEENTRKNQCIMSDIVCKMYALPDKCTILTVNETTPMRLFDRADILIFSPLDYSVNSVCDFGKKCGKPFLLDMPIIARGKDVGILESILHENIADGYVANNVYALEMCKDYPILLGTGMNSVSSALNYPKIMSFEAADIDSNAVLYAFGRVPLMNFSHCPRKQLGYNCANCANCGSLELSDEQGNKFILRRHKEHYCYFELLNCKIQNLLPKIIPEKHKRLLFDLRNIDERTADNILSSNHKPVFDERINTYGRFGKGVK